MSSSVPPARVPLRGAVDLAAVAAAREAQAAAEQRLASGESAPPALAFDVTEADFQSRVLDLSFEVPVVIDLWADWCQPCKALTPVLEGFVAEDGGAWVLARIDVDAEQRIAAAFSVQSIPSVFAVLKGQPVPLFQGALPPAQVRQYLDELLRVAAANGVAGHVSVDGVEPSAEAEAEPEPVGDPRFDAAYDAIEQGDWDAAEAAYRAVLADLPADPDARLGLAQVELLRRIDGVDPAVALAEAEAQPDSLAAQSLAADVELISGQVEDAFARLVELVRRSDGDERTAAREHLLTLFALVGDADPRVARARTALANALF